MAHRFHVVAARNVEAAVFEQALVSLAPQVADQPADQPFRFGSSGDWHWALASVWQVGGDDIDRALATLPDAALRVTTSDGILWMLTVTGGGEIFRGVHFFTWVGRTNWDEFVEQPPEDDPDFPEFAPDNVAGIDRDEPELQFLWDDEEAAGIASRARSEAAPEKPWQAYLEYGITFPAELIAKIEELPAHEGQRAAYYGHAEQIADALMKRGIPAQRDSLVQLLTIEPLTPQERESDLGNLPRFLAQLGIVGPFEELPQEQVPPPKQGIDWDGFQGRETMDAMVRLMRGHALAPVQGGPVVISFVDAVHLITLADYCDADDGPFMVSLRFAGEDVPLADDWANLGSGEVEVARGGGECAIAFKPTGYWLKIEDSREMAQHVLVRALSTLPDGVGVDLVQSVARTQDRFHAYRGTICAGGLQLTAAHPPLDAAAVDEALELLRLTLNTKSIPIDNPAEEQRIREAHHDATGDKPRIRQGKVKPEPGGRHAVVRCKVITRFLGRGLWDIEGAERRREEIDREVAAALESVAASNAEAAANDPEAIRFREKFEAAVRQSKIVPRTDQLLFAGRVTNYFHAPLLALPQITPEEVSECDRAMAELGFQWICDSASDRFGETITRAYAGPSVAVGLYCRRMPNYDFSGGFFYEFHTHFHDDSTLVTNDIEGATSIPKRRIFIRSYEGLAIERLFAKHIDGVERLARKRNTEPMDHTQFSTPTALLQVADSLMSRFLGEE